MQGASNTANSIRLGSVKNNDISNPSPSLFSIGGVSSTIKGNQTA